VRSRVVASNGEVIGLHIARGTSLRDGDCLCGDDGVVFMVRAAGETLSVIASQDPLELTRAAYHLGNRHVRLQIEPERLSYQTDHVLDDMLVQLGFVVEQAVLPFEPEPGAYHRHGDRSDPAHASHAHQHHHSLDTHLHTSGANVR
jgi:urease accessory protein